MPDINQVKQWTVSRPFVWEAKRKAIYSGRIQKTVVMDDLFERVKVGKGH